MISLAKVQLAKSVRCDLRRSAPPGAERIRIGRPGAELVRIGHPNPSEREIDAQIRALQKSRKRPSRSGLREMLDSLPDAASEDAARRAIHEALTNPAMPTLAQKGIEKITQQYRVTLFELRKSFEELPCGCEPQYIRVSKRLDDAQERLERLERSTARARARAELIRSFNDLDDQTKLAFLRTPKGRWFVEVMETP